jgi:hydroxylaminobenzene mutase
MNAACAFAGPRPSSPGVTAARHLARAGALLFVTSLLNGFVIQAIRLPRLALSAHLVGLLGAAFLFALAGLWPHLGFGPRGSRVGVALAIYGFVMGWLVYLMAAVTGAAGLFPMAGAGARGTPLAEAMMSAMLLTVAVALFALSAMVWRAARRARSAS